MPETLFPSNQDIIVTKFTGRTTNFTSSNLTNSYARAVYVVFDVTTVPGGDTLTFHLEFYDEASDKWVSVLSDAAQAGIVTRTYLVGGNVATASDGISIIRCRVLPGILRVRVVHSGSGAFDYSVGAHFCL